MSRSKSFFSNPLVRRSFYVAVGLSACGWILASVYVCSWGTTWVFDDGKFEAALAEKKKLEGDLKRAEEMGASEAQILECHLKLTDRLLESGDFVSAKDELERTDKFLADSKYVDDNHWRLKNRLLILSRIAAAYRDYGFYDDSRKTYERAEKLLTAYTQEANTTPLSQSHAGPQSKALPSDIEIARLNLINEEGVMQYLWANASAKAADRLTHFKIAESKYHQCYTDCRFDLKESGSEPNPTIERLAELSLNNLGELLKDVGRGHEIAHLKDG